MNNFITLDGNKWKYMGDKAMQNLKLVIFDMDGLLFDTEMISYKASVKLLKVNMTLIFR